MLSQYGLGRYEVSSHARPGHEAKHNQVYWSGTHFLALGPSAASFVPSAGLLGERRTNPAMRAWLDSKPPEVLPIDSEMFVQDVLMTGLRTRRGVDLTSLSVRSGIDVSEHYAAKLERLTGAGLLEHCGPYLRTTSSGLLQLNRVVAAFF